MPLEVLHLLKLFIMLPMHLGENCDQADQGEQTVQSEDLRWGSRAHLRKLKGRDPAFLAVTVRMYIPLGVVWVLTGGLAVATAEHPTRSAQATAPDGVPVLEASSRAEVATRH